eukprot:gene28428-31571_t
MWLSDDDQLLDVGQYDRSPDGYEVRLLGGGAKEDYSLSRDCSAVSTSGSDAWKEIFSTGDRTIFAVTFGIFKGFGASLFVKGSFGLGAALAVCEIGSAPSIALGGSLTGKLWGHAEMSVDVWIAAISVWGTVSIFDPVEGIVAATWGIDDLASGNKKPACTAYSLEVKGLGVRVGVERYVSHAISVIHG